MTRFDILTEKNRIIKASGITPYDLPMTFFYDESGNCRKFYLKNDEVNSVVTVNSMDALKGDFVLAGVAFDGFEKEIDIKGLYQALNYKEGQKELKFKHLYYKSNDFISFMKSKRATEFLQWLNDSGLYIHYSALNNLYYSLVDIVDSLYDIFPQYVQSFDMIKSALYDFAYENFDEMIRLLYEFNYPNVTDCQNFCNALCEAISMHSEYHHNHHLCLLTKMLKKAGLNNELIFVQNNELFVLIKEYYLFYIERCIVFNKSKHFFDEEPTVEKQFEEIELIENGKVVQNYTFIPSYQNIFIQISDLVSGLLRNLFIYLDSISTNNIKTILSNMESVQVDNFRIIWNLINRSDAKSSLMIRNSSAIKNNYERMYKLELLSQK